jgi:molybdopterin molybdotransferase
MPANISVAEAERLIQRARRPAPTVRVPLAEAAGCVLREPLRADRPLPPFDRVTMDGIAIEFRAWRQGCRQFQIEGVQAAGQPALRRRAPDGCLEVMTGAVLPAGCDTVIPVEDLTLQANQAIVAGNVDAGQFVHRTGSDASRGAMLIPAGKVLDGPAIAVAASVGKTHLHVQKTPSFAIVSTGEELVDVGERPLPHQIRLSNAHALAASLRLHGFPDVTIYRTGDVPPAGVLRAALRADIVLLTGGVSKGRFDAVPAMLKELGVREVFHRVRQRPGKPLWFGVRGRQLVFGLPGNPVSCLVCLHRYLFEPTEITIRRPLSRGATTLFRPVCAGEPVGINTSGDFADLAKSDGFVEVPEGASVIRRMRYWSWK